MKRLQATLAVLGLLLCVSSAEARPAPRSHARPAPTRLFHLPRVRVASPVWMGFGGKLAMLQSQQPGEPADVAIWDPRKNELGRATLTPALRFGLVGATDGRLAFIERGGSVPPPPPNPICKHGTDRIVVYDFEHGTQKSVFEGGELVPDSLHWSPDGSRLAFLCFDLAGQARLALLESGKPVQLTQLPINYQLESIAGFVGQRDVMAIATSPKGERVLLRIGHGGIASLPGAENPKLSYDGRLMLVNAVGSQGVALRGSAGGEHLLSRTSSCFAWGPADRIYLAEGRDVVAINTKGKLLRRYADVLGSPPDELAVSPDGKMLAIVISHALWALAL